MNHSPLSQLGQRIAPPAISWMMQTALARPDIVSLAAGFTDNETLPVTQTARLLGHTLRSRTVGRRALQYGSTQGDPRLRELTLERLYEIDGRPASRAAYDPQRTIITHGSQQMLYMVTEALCDPGDVVLVEDPTYFVYLGILQSHGIEVRGVRMNADGLDLAQLKSVLEGLERSGAIRKVKALYLVSYFQNPTGVTTAFQKKVDALKLLKRFERAAGHPIYLIEDAAYRELRFQGTDVPTALAIPKAAGRVIYAGTYSKPFATGARVGFGVLPEPVFTAVLRIKGNHDFGTANLLQQLLARALGTGAYQKHLAELRTRYARKARVMADGLSNRFRGQLDWWNPEGGLYFWAWLRSGAEAGLKSKLFQAALKAGVMYVPGELCYAPDPTRPTPRHEMRLSFGGASERNIRLGLQRLSAALKR